MKKISILISKIFDIKIGIPENTINCILPLIYESKKTYHIFGDIKSLKKVWGYGTTFQHNGKTIKMIDISTSWEIKRGLHRFKYIIVCDNIAIRVDDIINIKNFFFKEIYAFPLYLQKLLGLEYIWAIALDKKETIYLVDPKMLNCDRREV